MSPRRSDRRPTRMLGQAQALEEIRYDAETRMFGRFARMRLSVMPLPSALALWLSLSEPFGWRTVFLACCLATVIGFFTYEWLAFRRHGLAGIGISKTLAVMVAIQLVVVIATGGIESPILPPIIVLGVLVQMIGVAPVRRTVLAVQLVALAGLLALALAGGFPGFVPQVFGGGPRAGHPNLMLIVATFVFAMMLVITARLIGMVREAFDALMARIAGTRDALLALHADRANTLTALSAEIAHELKNPLASVKGLAALMAGGLEGKNAERMAVLRREVDRMQRVLEDFLNFTRPLGPLSCERALLRGMAESVVALHEGVCSARGITVTVSGGEQATVSCDPRKIHQVLVNLLQNAIEASPEGASIEIEVGQRGDGSGQLDILDRGHGIDPSLAPRVFEPGVTSKPTGSGIGLTVARGLVVQHGGELSLRPRAGGGCVAALTLPSVPAVPSVAAVPAVPAVLVGPSVPAGPARTS